MDLGGAATGVVLEELSQARLLDHAAQVSRTRRELEVHELRIAVQHAVLNNPETLDPAVSRLPGRERARRYGGLGTPRVAEFCCADLAARLGISPYAGASLIGDALDLLIRLPRLWARVQALEVRASYARHVARRTRDLSVEQAGYVDSRVVESADGRIPWSRFETLVEAAVAAADPEATAERERRAATDQFAKPTRSTEHGMRGFYVRGPAAIIAVLDARVAWIADILAALGDPDPVDHRRVKALAVLANPHLATELVTAFTQWKDRPADPPAPATPEEEESGQGQAHDEPARTGAKPVIDWTKVLPQVTLIVHTYAPACACDEPGTGILRLPGVGPVTTDWVRRWLGDATFTIRPVQGIEGQAPVDSYEVPDSHRRAVQVLTPADVFPFATNTDPHAHDIDHTIPFNPGTPGQSRIGNYSPLTRFHHRIKTHGDWDVHQPFPGIYLWRDPHGTHYLVDHTGTRRTAPPDRTPPPPLARLDHFTLSPFEEAVVRGFVA
ncbi:DUF222 domain-containing protein [Nocardioides solisilvae]|uniref:DUF222 domain-containing protein n=1 Tax=Nocardioides solisilvae TaxID=1542435 RepID=UPI0013A55325|nr:DUF222 domain-containing protein [Nocardioides solisilvae]